MAGEIYIDNNATTRVLPEVAEAMLPFLTEHYGNPSSIHRFGSEVGQKVDQARAQVTALIGAADPIEVIFTSCGTEGDNAAIRGMLEARPDKRHIVTTQVEHPAVLGLCQHLEKKGCRVTWLGVDENGALDLDELRSALTDDTALVSIMWANNETGVIFPIEKIAEIVRSKGIPFHVDAVQAAGKLPLEVKDLPIDLLTISAHKFHAPKGVGALYVRRGLTFSPFMIGGHHRHGQGGRDRARSHVRGRGWNRGAARSARRIVARVVPRQPSQWPGAKSLAEYFEYQFSIFGRGVDPGASRSARNMRLDRLRLHRGIVRAVARSACYERTR
jgi:cysteine desulfurase